MPRARGEAGQTSAELMGALLIVALIISALFASGVDAQIRDQVRRAICSIGAGTDCGDPGHSGGYADEAYEDSGLADREVYVKECDGSISDAPARAGDDDAVGDDQVDQAYENMGRVYDYYWETFGWDSYDGNGATMVGVVTNCGSGGSSFWDGDRVEYAPGAGDALDTSAHEFTHAVIEHTADLEYECQSGALNESIADIMAWNLDPEDTTYGEDRDDGAIRDYRHPPRFDQPYHVDDYEALPNDRFGDWGGVHINSGIPNHAYYQLVARVGRDKAEQILWRALTQHLEADSGFEDFRTAMLEAAGELYGNGGPVEHGVDEAFAVVGLDGTWEAPEQEGC